MKCVLLLAAVYSLIFHQWHKERGTTLAKLNETQKLEVKKTDANSPARYTAAVQFFMLNSYFDNK